MSKKDGKEKIALEEGSEFVSHTIVGGRAVRRKRVRINVPIGIEKILYRAAVNPAFKAALLADRAGTLEAHAVKLSSSESAILRSIPDATIELMIGNINPEKQGKRKFMKAVAAAAITIASGTMAVAVDGCGEPAGIEPDDVTEEVEAYPDVAGEMTEIPEEVVEVKVDEMVVGGEMPDIPREDAIDVQVEETMSHGVTPDVPDEAVADQEDEED